MNKTATYLGRFFQHYGIALCLSLIVSFFSCCTTYAQYDFSNFNVDDGLPQTQVICLYQDRQDYLWIGTYGGGVSRYDGKSFTNFNTQEGLGNNVVYGITEDLKGNIWFATDGGGVSCFNGRDFVNFTTANGLCDNHAYAILVDEQGSVWVGSNGGGISKIDLASMGDTIPENWIITNINTSDGLSSNEVMSLMEDHNGDLWIGTENGVSVLDVTLLPASFQEATVDLSTLSWKYYNKDNGLADNLIYAMMEDQYENIWIGTFGGGISVLAHQELLKTSNENINWIGYNESNGLPENLVTALQSDKTGNVWVGTYNKGVCRMSITKREVIEQTHFTMEDGLMNNRISSIIEDIEGNIWIGTEGGGLSQYQGDMFKHYTTHNGLIDNIISTIAKDDKGGVWFGTYGHGAMYRTQSGDISHYNMEDGLNENLVLSIYTDKQGTTWFGTGDGICKLIDDRFERVNIPLLKDANVLSMFEDVNGKMWFGADPGGLICYNPITESIIQVGMDRGLKSDIIWSITQDHLERFWIGTWGGGASCIEFDESNEPINMIHFAEQDGLGNDFVLSIEQDSAKRMWFATYGGGIAILDEDNIWYNISTSRGLSDNSAVSLLFDQKNNAWVGTNKGINKISNINGSLDKLQCRSYGKQEGFIGIECNQNALCLDKDGALWFGTANVLTKYNPYCDVLNEKEAGTYITGVRLNFEEVNWNDRFLKTNACRLPENLILPYDENHITFDFVGISLKQPKNVKYKYMLEGYDDDWSPALLETFATYPKLPAGHYVFKVKASNSDGVWNKDASVYSFSIAPPFWQTWWFYLMSVLLSLGIIVALVMLRINSLERAKRILEEQVKLRTNQLRKEKILVEKQKISLQKANADLHQTNNKLQELEDFKTAMMGMIVHDLKNPLNVVLGLSEGKPSQKVLDNINQSGQQMLNLVMNILDVQKFEDTVVQLDLGHYKVQRIVSNSVAQVQSLARSKRLTIHNNVVNDIVSECDVKVIERVLVNLMTNAIKYTPCDGVIKLSSLAIEESGMVLIEVSDNGEGIPADKIHTLFDPFTQVNPKDSGKTASTGLGLAFCKMVVEAHGGGIDVVTNASGGARFFFAIPLGDAYKAEGFAMEEPELVLVETSKLQFTKNEKAAFAALLTQLDEISVYHTSDNLKIISGFQTQDKLNSMQWIEEMTIAVLNCDEDKYYQLKEIVQ